MNHTFVLSTVIRCCISLFSLGTLHAQYEVATYNRANNYFNNGQPLPAEANLLLTGEVSAGVAQLEVGLFKAKSNHEKAPLYHTVWMRPEQQKENGFSLPINYKLHGNSDYDIVWTEFKPVSDAQFTALRSLLKESLDRMVAQNFSLQEGKVSSTSSAKRLQKKLEDFVMRALTGYRLPNTKFTGFSEVTSQAISYIDIENGSVKEATFQAAISSCQQQVQRELSLLLTRPMLIQSMQRTVRDYPTEKVAGSIAINVGYGGVYLDGDIDNLTYDDGGYVGLSLPLGSRTFSGRFLSNTSLSIGAFFQDFEGDNNTTYSGPIFGRPYFVGLGYSVFRFVRINAGAVALERRVGDTGPSVFQVQPFVGISAEINLSLTLGQKRN